MLRDYQLDLTNEIIDEFRRASSILVVLPTGAGKTYLAASLVGSRFQKILWVAHRIELLEQAHQAFSSLKHTGTITFHSIWKHPPQNQFDILVLDEAHHAPASTVRKFIQSTNYSKILGLTATPFRLDRQYLGFESIIYGVPQEQLIREGYLVPIDLYTVRVGGTPNQTIADWMDFHPGLLNKTIIFVRTHTEALFFQTVLSRYKVETIISTSNRSRLLDKFQNGNLNILISCEILTEGTDLPCISTIILARNTNSTGLLKQMIGRGLRPYSNKEKCIVVQTGTLYSKAKYLNVQSVMQPRQHLISYKSSGDWNTIKLRTD